MFDKHKKIFMFEAYNFCFKHIFLLHIMLQTYFNMLEDFTLSIFFKASKHVTYMFKASKHICTLPNLVVHSAMLSDHTSTSTRPKQALGGTRTPNKSDALSIAPQGLTLLIST